MRAAVETVQTRAPKAVVVAVPTASGHSVRELRGRVDDVVALIEPEPFHAVGLWYEDFREVFDDQVRQLLQIPPEQAVVAGTAGRCARRAAGGARPGRVRARLRVEPLQPRNRFVAGVLEEAGLATLLVDLLTTAEEMVDLRTREHRFDVELLAGRVGGGGALGRVGRADMRAPSRPVRRQHGRCRGARGRRAQARRRTCRRLPRRTSRPGRAGARRGPRADAADRRRGRRARARTEPAGSAGDGRAEADLVVVPGATHLFEERGALERAAEFARNWFVRRLAS